MILIQFDNEDKYNSLLQLHIINVHWLAEVYTCNDCFVLDYLGKSYVKQLLFT